MLGLFSFWGGVGWAWGVWGVGRAWAWAWVGVGVGVGVGGRGRGLGVGGRGRGLGVGGRGLLAWAYGCPGSVSWAANNSAGVFIAPGFCRRRLPMMTIT